MQKNVRIIVGTICLLISGILVQQVFRRILTTHEFLFLLAAIILFFVGSALRK